MKLNNLFAVYKRCIYLFFIISLIASAQSFASERYIRYKLLKPKVDSIAEVRFINHILSDSIHVSWTGIKLPGVLSQYGLYTQPGKWSDWYKFPDKKSWGTFYLDIKSTEKLTSVKVEAQVASYPDKSGIVKTLTIESDTGNSVGFVLPTDILEKPEWIQTLKEVYLNRLAVAKSVAIPKEKKPKLLSFTPSGVGTCPTIKNSLKNELEIVRMLGFNTLSLMQKASSSNFPFRIAHNTGSSLENDQKALEKYKNNNTAPYPPVIYSIIRDEPSWVSGFNPIWEATGEKGFYEYLLTNGVSPEVFGVKTMEQVKHINRKNIVEAEATIEQRRLWYWSCRYTYYAGGVYFRQQTETSQKTFSNTVTTVNFPSHSITMNGGMIASYGPDYFAYGRENALTMYWNEDWLFPYLSNWGNGLYQKVPFLAELLRSAARYHQNPPRLGFHIVNVGYAPFAKNKDRSNSLRLVMLLGRGVKDFSFFRYGPTSRATVDFWADNASIMRGVADAIQIAGGENIEPYVYEGKPIPGETCIIYGTSSEYWQTQNNKGKNNPEKQWLYCMLTQHQLPVEIIDSYDLNKFIGNYKAAYFIDTNIRHESAEKLLDWVKKGGVLCLWPDAASLDEYNEPLDIFDSATGTNKIGRGYIVRYDKYIAAEWWDNTKKLCKNANIPWPALFDFETSKMVAEPALKLAKITPPVKVNSPGIIADALVSDNGVAITLANLMGTFDEGGSRFLNLQVSYEDKSQMLTKAYSSRRGPLPVLRKGNIISVTMPLDSTDILIFSK